MRFEDLSWAAVCFYYRSMGDRKYCKIMADKDLLARLKTDPLSVPEKEFEQKVILDYVNVSSYDLLYKSRMSRKILDMLSENKGIIANLRNIDIIDCNLSDDIITRDIMRIYRAMLSVDGLWATGASKILHILNSSLFAPINQSITDCFRIYPEHEGYVSWLRIVQKNALEAVFDYKETHKSGDPSDFLSRSLHYDRCGFHKSIVKYIDEYYWLTVGDKLPIPPLWAPEFNYENVSHSKK